MKLKYFYRIDQSNNPVTASNVKRIAKPKGQWKELKNACCDPVEIPCQCDWRYFVQVDPHGNPVDHTLIKRKNRPNRDLIMNYMEVIPDACCTRFDGLSWFVFNEDDSNGSYQIKQYNTIRVGGEGEPLASDDGVFEFTDGATINIILNNPDAVEDSGILVTEDGIEIINQEGDDLSFNASFTAHAGKIYVITIHLGALVT